MSVYEPTRDYWPAAMPPDASPMAERIDDRMMQPVLPRRRMSIHLDAPLSDDEFQTLCQRNPQLIIEQSPDGSLVLMAPTGGASGNRNLTIGFHLAAWIEEHGGFGFDSNTMFRLPNGAHRMPDVAWVQRARFLALSEAEREGFVPLAPDFVIELRSPTDDLSALKDKMNEYMRAGVRLGWLIDPQTKTVTMYRDDGTQETLDQPATVVAETVVDGFTLPMARVWNPFGRAR